jgi:hypothetical protein
MLKLAKAADNKAYNLRKVIKSSNVDGTSFIINIDDLISSQCKDSDLASYIYLSSFRNYSDFILFGIKYLDISYIPDIDITLYKDNPLLSITDKLIKFKFEERVKNGN